MDGIIVVNKKKGMTSFDVVKKIGNIFGTRKVGHTGTLDPLAEGVLLVCVGKACKIVELLTAYDKEYIAGVKLGIETDTYDIEGQVLKQSEVPKNLDLEKVLKSFQKTYLQEVPIYSAVKVNGKKLYEYARNNLEVKLPKKEVTIKDIQLLSQKDDTFTFQAHVTKGCYIRSLIHDIGEKLGTGACMTSLTRTRQGKVSIDEAYTLEDIEKGNYHIYSIEEVLDYPQIIVDKELEFKISNGVKIPNNWNIIDKVLFLNEKKKLLGIYEVDNQMLKTWKNFS
ncbi:MAG: tRNA pseudouridine(55) synthase TruB [Bacilli bacterium]|nr:tRNA pseudouridine(55) synthase TruB [Bacilli bacterium]